MSVTDRCNLNCTHCYKKDEMKNLADLSLEDMKAIYDKFQPQMIQLFGGEPTLRWNDILEFIDYAYPKMVARGINNIPGHSTKISIISNGTTGVNWADIPVEYREGINISFSLDGFADNNDIYRGKGSYEKTHAAIQECLKNNIKVHIISSIPCEYYIENLDKLQEFSKYYEEELKVDSVAFATHFSPNTPETYNFFKSEKYRAAIKNIRKINSFENCHHIPLERGKGCQQQALYIGANGQISSRCSFLRNSYGHWTEYSKEDIFMIDKIHNYLKIDCTTTNFSNLNKRCERIKRK